MSTYRVEWDCCGSVTETEAWEPESCPFCTDAPKTAIEAAAPAMLEALECLIVGACAVACPNPSERAVLQEAVDIARAAIKAAKGEA